jgi:Spy/CpxP family protein refolding chaperone
MIGRLLAHAEELGLTDDQQTRIKEIGVAARKAMVQLRADSELARIELEGLIHTEDPDLAAIEDGLQNVASVQVATRLAQIEAGVNVRSVLTDEQQAKIKEHRRGGPGRRGSRGDGPKRGGPQRGRRPQQERH